MCRYKLLGIPSLDGCAVPGPLPATGWEKPWVEMVVDRIMKNILRTTEDRAKGVVSATASLTCHGVLVLIGVSYKQPSFYHCYFFSLSGLFHLTFLTLKVIIIEGTTQL